MATEVRDYTEFDKNLLARIEVGRKTAAALSTAMDADAKLLMNRTGGEFRVVERRGREFV